jgi:hypothetical protein
MLCLPDTRRNLRSVWRKALSLCLVLYDCPVAITLKQVGCIGSHAQWVRYECGGGGFCNGERSC